MNIYDYPKSTVYTLLCIEVDAVLLFLFSFCLLNVNGGGKEWDNSESYFISIWGYLDIEGPIEAHTQPNYKP